jgi:hypothetical protein
MFEKKIIFIEDLPPLRFDDIPGDKSFTYAKIEQFSAIYFITNIYDFTNNKLGDTRYDSKIVFSPEGITITYNSISKLKTECGCHDVFIYSSGTRKYNFLLNEYKIDYENIVVQNIVIGDKTYNKGSYESKLDLKTNKLIITVTY